MNPVSSKLEKPIYFDCRSNVVPSQSRFIFIRKNEMTLAQFTLMIRKVYLPKIQYFDFKVDGLDREYRWSINQKNILTLSKNWDDQVVQSEEFDLSEVDNTPKISELFKSKEKEVKLFIKPVDKKEQKNN